MSKILLVITTYNESEYTKKCFESMEHLDEDIDVLVIADCSTDDTVDICNQYGYEVITKDEVKGLTDSWNLGYQRFKEKNHLLYEGYDYLIIANNDILIPIGSLTELLSVFEKWPYTVVVPLSTENGVGHTERQAIDKYYPYFPKEKYDHPDYYQETQKNILDVKEKLIESNELYQADPIRMKHFNGFFFMMNKNVINYEYEKDILFNPKFRMTKNEDELNWSKLIPNDDYPAVCRTSFIYHFKGVTARGDLRSNKKWKDTRLKNER